MPGLPSGEAIEAQADELELYATNTYDLYTRGRAIARAIARAKVRGRYREDLALKAFYTLGGEIAKRYIKEIGKDNHFVQGRAWYVAFSPAVRRHLAASLLAWYEEEIADMVADLEAGNPPRGDTHE